MCIAQGSNGQSGGKRLDKNSLGSRLDKAQRDAMATVNGGTSAQGGLNKTILTGAPRNSDADAQRKITMLGV